MKIYVYKDEDGLLSCYKMAIDAEDETFVQEIDAEPTDLPITDPFASDDEILIGEVFNCNGIVPNLIRTA